MPGFVGSQRIPQQSGHKKRTMNALLVPASNGENQLQPTLGTSVGTWEGARCAGAQIVPKKVADVNATLLNTPGECRRLIW